MNSTSTTIATTGAQLTATLATLCALHCAVTPLLVVTMPALAVTENVERGAILLTAVAGTATLLMGPARRKSAIVVSFAAGTAIWFASLAGWFAPLPETVTSATGSLVVAAALFRGAAICRRGACEHCAPSEPRARPGDFAQS